jgi:hypothetical protein
MPQAFAAKHPTGISLDNPQNYRIMPLERGHQSNMAASEDMFREMNAPEDSMSGDTLAKIEAVADSMSAHHEGENSGGSIAAIHGPTRPAGSTLDFLERTALDAQVSSDKIRSIVKNVDNKATYPGSQLANSLKLVAKLIAGGLHTRIFYVSQGGYDTHTNQLNTQDRLLRELGDSVKAFVEDLKAQGNLERVMVMTFSEFGRRVTENANSGTDHGAAAPMFLIGDKVKAGLLGQYPSLAPGDLFQGDLKYNVDFRSVYASVLESWLKTRSEPILGQKFTPLPII